MAHRCRGCLFGAIHDPLPRNPGRPDRKYFVGMPIPAAAGLLAATVHYFYGIPVQAWWVAIPWLMLVGLSAFLMVSTWRFWSGKEINLGRRHPFQLLLLVSMFLYILIRFSQVMLFGIALVYMTPSGNNSFIVLSAALDECVKQPREINTAD